MLKMLSVDFLFCYSKYLTLFVCKYTLMTFILCEYHSPELVFYFIEKHLKRILRIFKSNINRLNFVNLSSFLLSVALVYLHFIMCTLILMQLLLIVHCVNGKKYDVLLRVQLYPLYLMILFEKPWYIIIRIPIKNKLKFFFK